MYKDENIIKVATDVDHDVEFVAEIGYIASRVRYLEQTFLDYFDSYPDTDIGEFLYIDQDHDILEDKLQQVHKQLEINQKQQPLNNIKDIDWFNVGGLGNIEENVYNRQYKEENQQNKNSILKSSTPSTLDDSTLLCSAKNRQNLLQDLLIKFYEEYDKIKTVTNKFARKETTLQRKTSIIMNISSEDKLPEKFCSCNTSSSSCNGNQFLQQQQQQHKDISLINQQSTISTTETTGTSSSTTARSDGGDDKNLISEIHICNNCNNKLNVGNKDSNIRNIDGEKGEQQKEFQQGCNEYGAVCDINSTKTYCIIGDGGNLNKIKNDDLINDVKSRKIIDKCSSCGDSILNENVFKMHGIGISEYSLLEFKNTIKNCHFNDDDLRAIIKDLKRKIEYTEKMNWLCLSKCPMGPPHRKSSLPKHTEVKKRFLEICDNNLSDEVKAALRLPAFDSYDWEDADVIHLMQTMFTELGLVDKFNIPKSTLREWLYEVYKHYNQVPFHNFRHCFCVAQMMYAIARQANLIARLGELEVLILLVSCICHDLDHPGYNNIYQINARTELALRYNDISPLENHHCSIAFRLLEHPDCNIFKNFSRETFNVIREGIIRCILATDMARHNEILTQFKDVVSTFDYTNRSHINLLCMILIKVADISNEARPMDVAEPWLDRLLTEFFAQSAAEKSEGLPVTPFMDPDKVSKPGSQVRFIGLVLLPLFEALGDLLPELTELIIIPVRVALDYYKRLNDAQSKARKSLVENIENNPDGGGGGGSSGSPQLPRSQSGISVRSRRSIPSQKSTSRTSVDEPICIAAELHDLPEGSESGDSETATEVDVAEKASKFKVDTEGSSNRSKSSHSTSRKSSREKRPSMISEMCSSGGRIRNSYGNIHGYHSSRCQFGTNRAVSLDQYSCNNRRLSDGLQQVISDSNVFYNRRNCSLDNTDVVVNNLIDLHIKKPKINENISSVNANVSTAATVAVAAAAASFGVVVGEDLLNMNISNSYITMQQQQQQQQSQQQLYIKNEGNNSGNGNDEGENGGGNCSSQNSGTIQQQQQKQTTWKARFKQITDIFTFNFDRTNKRYGNNSGIVGGGPTSTKSSPCSIRNNNSTTATRQNDNMLQQHLYKSKTSGICCTITNNLSPNLKHKQQLEFINTGGRNRAYSLDVPARNRYSSSSGGGDSSRKSSKNEDNSNNKCDYLNEDNNSNHTSIGEGLSAPPPQIRIGSNDQQSPIITTPPMTDIVNTGDVGCNMDLGNEHCYGRSSSSSSCGIAVAQTSSSGRPTI